MSTLAVVLSLYGGLAIFSWPFFWSHRLKVEVGSHGYIDNEDLWLHGSIAFLMSALWPLSWLFLFFRWLFRTISRTSNRAWWVPKSVRDKYRR